MAYCSNCGHELPENHNYCPQCGTPQNGPQKTAEEVKQAITKLGEQNDNQILLMIAFIFACISCLGLLIGAFTTHGLSLIGLAWCVPMTIRVYNIWKGKAQNTVTFGVLTLIFVSLVGGILLLVAPKDN